MTDEEHKNAYYKEIDLVREFSNRNENARDATLMQLSVGLLAVLATLGKDVIQANTTISYIMLGFLGVTILIIVTGFLTTSKMYAAIISKMQKNIVGGDRFYRDYTENPWQDVNRFLNYAAYTFFVLGITFFMILFVIYIGSFDGR